MNGIFSEQAHWRPARFAGTNEMVPGTRGQSARHRRGTDLRAGLSVIAVIAAIGTASLAVPAITFAQDGTPAPEAGEPGPSDTGESTDPAGTETPADGETEPGAPILKPGSVAVTGFSGVTFPAEGIKPGIDPLDETFIDPKGATLRIFDLTQVGEAPKGQVINTPPPIKVTAEQIGQVFGLAYDDGKIEGSAERIPNLYVTASTLHGLQIVGADADGDGRPERLKKGATNARFMDGQFGDKLGGGPGSIYKIDGKTGEVTLFANVTLKGEENSGPGLGNITFDPVSRHLYAADLDTGMIHRFDLTGKDLGTFDHGVQGRPKKELAPAAHDPKKRMDITAASFEVAKTETWGLADPKRRVFALAVYGGRLYYSVQEGQQIWSIGLKDDGSFADDARWELNAAVDPENVITDITFDKRGLMYVAARGKTQNAYDYATFAREKENDVLRYRLEDPEDPETPSRWVQQPDTYAVGLPTGHKMALGGIDLGYGYDDQGRIAKNKCDGTLFKTGDDLRNDETRKAELIELGALNIHGLQITDRRLIRPQNEPPMKSYYLDFDGVHEDPEVRGHVGDVEVFHPCLKNGADLTGRGDVVPGPANVPLEPPPGEGDPGGDPGDGGDPGGGPGGGPKACLRAELVNFSCSAAGVLQAHILIDNTQIPGADSAQFVSALPGISVSPKQQTVPAGGPFSLSLNGALPGETVTLDVCSFKKSDADAGGTFNCCKAKVNVTLPPGGCI